MNGAGSSCDTSLSPLCATGHGKRLGSSATRPTAENLPHYRTVDCVAECAHPASATQPAQSTTTTTRLGCPAPELLCDARAVRVRSVSTTSTATPAGRRCACRATSRQPTSHRSGPCAPRAASASASNRTRTGDQDLFGSEAPREEARRYSLPGACMVVVCDTSSSLIFKTAPRLSTFN